MNKLCLSLLYLLALNLSTQCMLENPVSRTVGPVSSDRAQKISRLRNDIFDAKNPEEYEQARKALNKYLIRLGRIYLKINGKKKTAETNLIQEGRNYLDERGIKVRKYPRSFKVYRQGLLKKIKASKLRSSEVIIDEIYNQTNQPLYLAVKHPEETGKILQEYLIPQSTVQYPKLKLKKDVKLGFPTVAIKGKLSSNTVTYTPSGKTPHLGLGVSENKNGELDLQKLIN